MKPRLLLFEFHHLGDAVLCLPFIRAALETRDVVVCCRPSQKEVFEMLLAPEKIIVWEPFWTGGEGWSWGGLQRIGKRLKELGADEAVSGWSDARVALLMVLSGAPVRVGFPMSRINYFSWKAAGTRNRLWEGWLFQWAARILGGKKLLTHSLTRDSWEQAHWKDWCQAGEALGFAVSMKTPWIPEVGTEDIASDWLMHMGARLPEKRWPTGGFSEVVLQYLEPEKHKWVCIAPKGEVETVPEVLLSRKIDPAGWKELIEKVSGTRAVLCHDSAVAHLASALGKRVVSLFGSRNPSWFAPYGNEQWVVTSASVLDDRPLSGIESGSVIEKMKDALRQE